MVGPLLCPYIWMSLSLILVFIGVLSLTFFLCLPLENPFEALRCNSIADVERHDWSDEVLSQQSLPLAGLLVGESESIEQAHFAVDKVALFVLTHQLHSRLADIVLIELLDIHDRSIILSAEPLAALPTLTPSSSVATRHSASKLASTLAAPSVRSADVAAELPW